MLISLHFFAFQYLDEYYEKTTAVVTDQLKTWLKNANGDIEKEIKVWDRWIDIWSQFTLESFLESNIDVIRAKISKVNRQDLDEETLGDLLPWSDDAVRGYSVSTYTEQLDQSLVQYLRDQLGQWWSKNMHTLVGGMHSLPEAFFGSDGLDKVKDIEFKKQVSKISYGSVPSEPNKDFVEVTCYPNDTESDSTYTARVCSRTRQSAAVKPNMQGRFDSLGVSFRHCTLNDFRPLCNQLKLIKRVTVPWLPLK